MRYQKSIPGKAGVLILYGCAKLGHRVSGVEVPALLHFDMCDSDGCFVHDALFALTIFFAAKGLLLILEYSDGGGGGVMFVSDKVPAETQHSLIS